VKKSLVIPGLLAAGALALAGCATPPPAATSSASATVPQSDFKACMVSDAGGFDDKSFNETSYNGLLRARDELGVQTGEIQSQNASDYAQNVKAMVDAKCNVIVTVGFALGDATAAAAKANPDIKFAIVDFAYDKPEANVKGLVFNTAEPSFMAGYLAGSLSEAGKVGTFGGQPYPTVTIFMDGFKQGVEYYNSEKGTNVEVIGFEGGDQGSFTGGFAANDEAKGVAAGIIDQGVDVILPVGGPIYQSAMDAIADSGRDIALIGVDADFFETDPSTQDIVLTSILKKMDVSVYDALMESGQGNVNNDAYIGTLENGGVGIAPLHNFEDKVDAELVAEVEALQEAIIAGEVEVTSYLN